MRGEEYFDPGAKYHVPANTPYARYFLSYVLQFQFHRALTKVAGCTTPLHRCSIYGSAEAGTRLKTVLAMGVSKPWPEALEALTGERQLDANAIADYFAPLKTWLDEQNKGARPAGNVTIDHRLLDGRAVRDRILGEVTTRVRDAAATHVIGRLVSVSIGEHKAAAVYVRGQANCGEESGPAIRGADLAQRVDPGRVQGAHREDE